MKNFKIKKLPDQFGMHQDEWMFSNMVAKYGRKWAKKQLKRKKEFTFVWVLLIVAFFLFIVGVVFSILAVKELNNITEDFKIVEEVKPILVNMEDYSCPPNLTPYQCETFVRTALVNGFDVEGFLLSRYNKSIEVELKYE